MYDVDSIDNRDDDKRSRAPIAAQQRMGEGFLVCSLNTRFSVSWN